MDKKPRKKFRDTKIGHFLKDKSPKVLDVVGDMLPDSGILGVAKNLINMAEDLTQDEKVELNSQLDSMIELSKLEVTDRVSARTREVEVSKTAKHDFLFTLTGLIGLGVFCFIVFAIVFLEIPNSNKEIWIHLIGISEGVVLSIFGYYFGSAMKKNNN
jgi:hypothetical protein